MGFDLNVSIPVITVFLQGILSFLSPCIFPLIPLYIGYLSGGTAKRDGEGNLLYDRKRVLVNTVFFVAGISFTFFLLGLGVSAAGSFFKDYQAMFAKAGGILVIALGLYQLGVFGSSRILGNEHRLPLRMDKMAMSPLTALLMGFSFSFAWTPCVGPALSGVLLMTASAETRVKGFLMIGVYTLGFVLPFLAVGVFTTSLLKLFKRHMNVVKYTVKIGAVLMILMGLMMFTGTMNNITGYLSGTAQGGEETVSEEDSTQQEEAGDTTEETALEDLVLMDQYGKEHRLSDYRGKVVFLNFWATWCPPCKAEMPDIQELHEEYQKQGEDAEVVILGVSLPGFGQEGSKEEIASFMEENGYTYPTLMDVDAELTQRYGITSYPTTFMIDKEGAVYGYISGMLGKEQMKDIIRQTIEGKQE